MTAARGGADGTGTSGAAPAAGERPGPPGPPAQPGPDEAHTEHVGPSDPADADPVDRGDVGTADAEASADDAGHDMPAAEHEVPPPAAGPLTNALVAVAVIGLGVATLLGSIALGAGSARAPDTGTWPLLVSGVLVALGVALLALARRTHDAERFSRAGLLVLAGLATMAGFVAVLEVIGFEIPAAVLTFVWIRFLGGEGLRTSIVTSIGVTVAFYVVFVGLLGVPVPHMF